MVAIFTGLGAGFERGSGAALGASGLLGSASFGRDGQGLFLNVANGNLIITDQDEFLVGRGPDVGISRTYNSFGALDENGDRWRQSTDRRVFGLVGTENTAGSSIRRVSADGSEIVYTWNGSFYQSSAGEGAEDRLTYASGSWTWTDGDSQIIETYAVYGTNNYRIATQTDSDGNVLTFTYTADKLTRIETEDGGYTDYVWSGSNIASIVTGYTDLVTLASATLTRTRYEYDGQNRLIKVITDLTPGDNSIGDDAVYTTQYTYHGSSKLIASIEQTDGARVDITYDARGRVTEIVQAVASGNSRTTSVEYLAYRTIVTDPRGEDTTLHYNAAGQLTKIVSPPAQSGAAVQTVEFEYEFPPGNLSAHGIDIMDQGEQSSGGVPVDWIFATEVIEGREAFTARKPWGYLQPWDNWNNPGSVFLRGGDRPDGSFSVTEGETVGYRFASKWLDAARYVVSQIVFVNAQGTVVSTGGDHWNNTWGWSQNTGIAVVPDGAVAAFVLVRPMDHAEPTASAFGFAFTDFQFQKLPSGATSVPDWTPTANLMWGGDLSAGTSVFQNGFAAGGGTATAWVMNIATVDGQEAMSFTKPWGYLQGDYWNNPGSVILAGGDRPDGSFTVKPGEKIGYRFAANTLEGASHIISVIQFLDAAGNQVGQNGSHWNSASGWTENVGSATVPVGAVAARIHVSPYGYNVPSATPMGVAVRQVQVYRSAAGVTAVPTLNNATPVGKLRRVTDAAGLKTNYTYDNNGNLSGITDANGNTVQRAYDSRNNLILEARTGSYAGAASGALYTRYVYDAENHLRYAISAEGRVTEYSYTTPGDLEFTREYTQAAHLYPLSDTVPTEATMDAWRDGLSDRSLINISQIIYDDRGAVKETKRWSSATTSGNAVTTDGQTHQFFTYDQAGQLLNRTVAGQQTESFVYDGMGRVVLSTDLAGGITKFFFDDDASTTVVTSAVTSVGAETADSYVVTSVYNKAGELISRTDGGSSAGGDYTNGGVATSLYDKNGQLRVTTDGTGFNSYFLYDKTGRRIADIGHGGQITEYRYDQAGRLVATVRYTNTLTSGQITSLANPDGEVEIASIRPAAHAQDIWQWSIYDAAGRVIETIAGDGSVTRYQYDQSDRLIATTGYYNKLTSGQISGFMTTAPTALVLPTSDARDAITRTFYDRDGFLIGSLNAEGILSRISYDGAGQKIQEAVFGKATLASLRASGTFDQLLASVGSSPALDITTRYVYDSQGLLRWTVDALNQVTEYIYWEGTTTQAVGLVRKTITYADPIAVLSSYNRSTLAAATASLASDPDNRVAYNVYNDRAQLSYSVAATGAVTGFTYDALGRVTKATQYAVLAILPLSGAETSWKGNLDTWAASNGAGARITRSYYSERGELRFAIDAEGYVTQNDYDDAGRLYTQHRYPTKVTANDSWVIATVDGASKGTAVATQFRYDTLGRLSDVYDALGTRRTTLYYANGTKQYEIVANGQGADEVRTLYKYDQSGRLTQIFYAADTAQQVVESYEYDGFGNTKSVTDARSNTTQFTHDKLGRVLTQTNAMSGVIRYGYDAFGRNVVTVDARGARTYTAYDQAGRTTAVIDAEGYVTTTTYTAFGEVATVTRHSNKAANTYSSPWWLAGGTGYTVAQEAIDGQRVVTARNAVGEIPGWHWAAWGGEVIVLPGNLDGHVPVAAGDTISVSYDAKALTPGLTFHVKFTFRLSGGGSVDGGWTDVPAGADWTTIATSMTAPANAVSVRVAIYSYRPDANVSGGFDFAVRGLKLLRNSVEQVIPLVATDADDATTSFEYDKLGRVTRVVDAEIDPNAPTQRAYEQYTLDAFGQRTAVRNKLGGWTYNVYDKRGLLTQETLPVASYTAGGSLQATNVVNKFVYDSRGNRTEMIEAFGLTEQRTTIYQYDNINRLTHKIGDGVYAAANATGAMTISSTVQPIEQYFYDLRGNLIETRDASNARTLRWYDKLDRVSHTVSPGGTLTRNFYDANGNLTETRTYATVPDPLPTDATGTPPAGSGAYRVTEFSYDALNRMTESRTPNVQIASYNVGTSALSVATQTLTTQFEYDAAGNVIRTTDPRGSQIYTYYDKLGRKIIQIDAENYRTNWTYDSDGNVLEERRYSTVSSAPTSTATPPAAPGSTSNDRITTFAYDKMGRRLHEIRLNVKVFNGTGGYSTQNAVIGYTYNALGQVTRKTEGTAEYTKYAYDDGGRMIREERAAFLDFNGVEVTPTVDYYYNGLDDLARTRQRGATGADERVTQYVYGTGGRLSSMEDATGFVRSYVYDVAGRLLREVYDLDPTPTGYMWTAIGYQYDAEGRVVQQGMMKDDGGNWTRAGLDTVFNRYNAFGEIYERGIGGTVFAEQFAYDNAGRLWRTNSGDGVWKYFLYDAAGNQALAITSDGMDIGGQTMEWVLDRWGSTRAAIATDYAADIVATITAYDKRQQAIRVLEPQRERGAPSRENYVTIRQYNAFGEVSYEESAYGGSINYTYNTMGRLITVESPWVQGKGENGKWIVGYDSSYAPLATSDTAAWFRPTEHRYYDLGGRLVASRDANGNLTKNYYLAGTGYGGSQALTTHVVTADSAVVATSYDIHGDARRVYDQLSRITNQTFDRMGRVTEVQAASGLIEQYRYDGLGQRTHRWNNLLNPTNSLSSVDLERTVYDRQGRITEHMAMGGDITTYAYAWVDGITTTGLGAFGGWGQTTTYANGKTLNETTGYFGHEVSKTDLGYHVADSTYDKAGRLTRRTGGVAINYTYFNTGRLESSFTDNYTGTGSFEQANAYYTWYPDVYAGMLNQNNRPEHDFEFVGDADADGDNDIYDGAFWHYANFGAGEGRMAPGAIQMRQRTWFAYDKAGNLTYQRQAEEIHNDILMESNAYYDTLGRMMTWTESATATSPAANIAYEYDANGNIRRSNSQYYMLNGTGGTISQQTQDYWYKYDALNRVTTQKGILSGGVISRGLEGVDYQYDAAGQRTVALSSFWDVYYTQDQVWDESLQEYVYVQVPNDFVNTRRERYYYDAGGRLDWVYVNEGTFSEGPPSGDGVIRAAYDYDLMGRMTGQWDYNSNGYEGGGSLANAIFQRWTTFNSKGQIVYDNTVTKRGSTTLQTQSTYDYGSGVNYLLGAVASVTIDNYQNGSFTQTSLTTNGYNWYDGAVQSSVSHQANISSGPTHHSIYYYNVFGNHAQLRSVAIRDGRVRTVAFTNDMNGQVIRRDEEDRKMTSANGDPHEVFYRLGGKQMGYTGNNATLNTAYPDSINARTATIGTGAFRNGSTSHNPYADFDQSLTSFTSYDQGSLSGGYTVRSGETLASIAANLWGDASLWYKLAEVNGLSGQTALMEGQTLQIPAGVTKSTHNASTFKAYEPGEVIGDTSPTTPLQPRPAAKNKCGAFGQILLIIIAVAVTIATQGATTGFFANTLGLGQGLAASVAGGATAAAAGSVASQSVGVATGIQDKFSWNAVAMAAIAGGVGGGLSEISALSGSSSGMTAVRGALGSAISQGVNMAVGLQRNFSWAGVAAAGVGAAVGNMVGAAVGAEAFTTSQSAANLGKNLVQASANAIGNAATRSLIDGSDFGDNVLAALPDVIGSTIGSAIGGGIVNAAERRQILKSAAKQNAANFQSAVFGDAPLSEAQVVQMQDVARTMEGAALNAGDKKARTALERSVSDLLEANRGLESVDAFFRSIGEAQTAPSLDGGDRITVTGDRDYWIGSTVDSAGIWVGEQATQIETSIGQFIKDNPGAGIALSVADMALTVGGGAIRWGADQALGFFEEQAQAFVTGQLEGERRWSTEKAENGGKGMVLAGGVLLGGLGSLLAAGKGKSGPLGGDLNLASEKRTKHILYGDATGGGHKFGFSRLFNGKTKFPATWSEQKIMTAVSDIATDPKSVWHQQTGPKGSLYTNAGDPVRFKVSGIRDGVPIEVIVEPAGEGIISAWRVK